MIIAKIESLIQLLGWFYLSIIGYAAVYALAGKRRELVSQLFYGVFGLYALLLAYRSIQTELILFPQSAESFTKRFEQKIANEYGTYYDTYYKTYRPLMPSRGRVMLVGAPTREYHVARMYLYPHGVIEGETVGPDGTIFGVIPQDHLLRYGETVSVLGTSHGTYLVERK